MPIQYLTQLFFKLCCFNWHLVDTKVFHFSFIKLATLIVNISQQLKLSFIYDFFFTLETNRLFVY